MDFVAAQTRRRSQPTALAAALAIGLTMAAAGAAGAADDVIRVKLKSGRSFIAQIDPQSDADVLRLRFERDGVVIVRPIEWTSIVSASRNDAVVDLAALRVDLAARRVLAPPSNGQPHELPIGNQARASRGRVTLWKVPLDSVAASPPAEPVRSIAVDAYLANWDADVDVDGLVVDVEFRDAYGNPTTAEATFAAELVGERYPPLTRGNALPILGRWTKQVAGGEFIAPGLWRTRLEFQAVHPDYQLWLSRYGLVHARVLVPGQGTFEASVDGLALRGFTPVRDRTQAAFGTRFLPTEATGRGHRESAVGVW